MSPRGLAKRSIILTCFYYLVDDWRARRRLARGNLATRSGTRHATLSLNESLDYIERVYGDYLAYGGLTRFSGRIAEIGPGDNFGVALRMLGDGAKEVHTIDRYRPRYDDPRQTRIYRALAARHGFDRLLADTGSEEARDSRPDNPLGYASREFLPSKRYEIRSYRESRGAGASLRPAWRARRHGRVAGPWWHPDTPHRSSRPRHVRGAPSAYFPDHSRCPVPRHDPRRRTAESCAVSVLAGLARSIAAHGVVADHPARRGGR